MPIATITLPPAGALATTQTGSFITDAAGPVTTTLTAAAVALASRISVASSAPFGAGAELITIPGGGRSAIDLYTFAYAINAVAANQIDIPNTVLITGVASGTTISKWDRVPFQGQPSHVRITRQDNGDYYDWTAGMEPYSSNAMLGGVGSVAANSMLITPGNVYFNPTLLVASKTYTILIEF